MSKVFAFLGMLLCVVSSAVAQDIDSGIFQARSISIEKCPPGACPTDISPIDHLDDDQGPDVTDPIEVNPLPGLLGEQIRRLRDLLLRLPFTNWCGLSRGKVWDVVQDWLEGLEFPAEILPSDLQVLDPVDNRETIDRFLRRFKTFLGTQKIAQLRILINSLKELFRNRPDLVAILDELLRLIEGLDGNSNIPQYIIDLLHDLIRDLIFEPVSKSAAANADPIGAAPCPGPSLDPVLASTTTW